MKAKNLLKMVIFFAGALVIFRGFSQNAEAQEIRSSSSETHLTVMNYNIKGLSGFFGGNKKENLKRIMDELMLQFRSGSAPDVVLFQEVFSSDANKIVKKLHAPDLYPYRVKGPEESSGYIYNSGLVALSRFPILSNEIIAFNKACASWDCHSNKGAQLLTIQAENWPEPVRILNTHMQAHNENDSIRLQQIQILKNFYAKYEENPLNTIFAGDFNFKPNRPSYEVFKSNFKNFQNVGEYCFANPAYCQVHPQVASSLLYMDTKDHQFYSCSRTSAITPVYLVRNFSKEVDDLELSDHKAYQVQYKIDWNKRGCVN